LEVFTMSPRLRRLPPFTAARTPVAAALLCLIAPFAGAQTTAPATDPITVTANRVAQPLSSVLADLSVLQRDAIERSGATCVADLLARLPGVSFARNGGPGNTTSVYIRGTENRHTAVYIDGVRVESQSTGGPQWEQLPLANVERIEVLRGPAAAVYGSDAIGGVVQIFTRRGQGPLQATAAFTVASLNTQGVEASLSGSSGPVDYAVSASGGRSDGFNARTTATANPDRDGWKRHQAQASLGWTLAPGQRLEAGLQSSRLRGQYDGSATADDISTHTLDTATAAYSGQWSPAASTRLSLGQSKATYETQPSYYRTETTLRNLVASHQQRVGGQHFTATFERREDELLNPATAWAPTFDAQRHQNALGLGWRSDFGAHGLQLHLRHDDDSSFGDHDTGSLAWGWAFASGWRVTASAASSFRAPTLYQSFSEYGPVAPAPALKPETGRNVELGLRWAQGGTELALVTWRNRVDDLINYGAAGSCPSPYGCYENVGRAQYDGSTLSASQRVGRFNWRASADWHNPRNLDTGKQLARRARQMGTLGVDAQFNGFSLGADVQASGHRYDNAGNTVRLAGYALLGLVAQVPLAKGLSLDLRVDNATDAHYQLANAYATTGRSAQATLRWALR
jgi:vitamin B12 transporter